jgi:hypothetical protein
LQPVYLVSIKNLSKFLEALRHAQAPDKVSLRFVEELGFTSTNDRLFIPLLRALKFIDEAGKPTARYHAFLDDTQWKQILAEGIKDAYADLFRVNRNAQTLSRDQVSGKIKSLSEGKVSPAVLANSTKTFTELVKLADFAGSSQEAQFTEPDTTSNDVEPAVSSGDLSIQPTIGSGPTLVYRIEIVLPAVRDQAIYDAIFRSAKEHLLK